MASSSHHSGNREKAIVDARGVDPSGWINDNETREIFLKGKRIKIVVPHNHLKLDLFEKEGFQLPEWIETQGLPTPVQMKDQFRHLTERVTRIEGKINNLQQQRVNNSSEGSEESFEEDSMDMSNSD
ncbi:hypothetical protein LR48_Vigan10g072600 [Vigna angularis]|uniref:Uncharacterized protein n=1 Tax=Phaseolus angularis TaxID=3914 RepID=A0A0L9VJC4_PHAAN|nr:hypothetical protein LR48_Vigan10g072600 [Vigna angularis]